MNRRTVWSLALAFLVTAFLAADASARTFVPTPNLSGAWRLEQGWKGQPNRMGPMADLALPRAFQIDQGQNRLRVTNRRGDVVQVVLFDGHFGFGGNDRYGDQGGRDRFGDRTYRDRNTNDRGYGRGYGGMNDRDVLIGQWHGPLLEAQQMGPRGTQVTQTFRLANRGRTLVVRTEVARGRSGATMQIEQVFERA